MSDYTDDIADGMYCCECGQYIYDGEEPVYLRKCKGCGGNDFDDDYDDDEYDEDEDEEE